MRHSIDRNSIESSARKQRRVNEDTNSNRKSLYDEISHSCLDGLTKEDNEDEEEIEKASKRFS